MWSSIVKEFILNKLTFNYKVISNKKHTIHNPIFFFAETIQVPHWEMRLNFRTFVVFAFFYLNRFSL